MEKATETTSREVYRAQQEQRLRLLFQYWDTVKRVVEEGRSENDPDFSIQDVLRGDSDLLKEEIEKRIKEYFADILDTLESGVQDSDPQIEARMKMFFKKARGKILDGGNDAIRDLSKEIDNYHVLKTRETKEVFRAEFNYKGVGE